MRFRLDECLVCGLRYKEYDAVELHGFWFCSQAHYEKAVTHYMPDDFKMRNYKDSPQCKEFVSFYPEEFTQPGSQERFKREVLEDAASWKISREVNFSIAETRLLQDAIDASQEIWQKQVDEKIKATDKLIAPVLKEHERREKEFDRLYDKAWEEHRTFQEKEHLAQLEAELWQPRPFKS